jgi:hypothetical protein
MKVTEMIWILGNLLLIPTLATSLELTLDLPSGEKTLKFHREAQDHYNPKPYIKKMMKMEGKYIKCIHENGIKKESFIECVGENYSKIMSDFLAEYFEFLKEVNHFINEQKLVLCKAHYSRFCPDIDMFMREQLAAENLHKETFVDIFKGLKLSEEFRDKAYYEYLRHLFKAVDELVEMRKLAVSYITMGAKKCEKYIRNFKFMSLGYDAGDMERIKILMGRIDDHLTPEFEQEIQKGVKKVLKGDTITKIPAMPIWGNEQFQNEDSDSISSGEGDGKAVEIGGHTLHLDHDSSNVRNDSFNNSVLREKDYMELLKNLEARGNLKYEGHDEEKHSTQHEQSLYDLKDLDSFTLG